MPTDASQRSLARTESVLQVDAQFWDLYLPQEDSVLDGSIGGVLSAPWIPTVRALAEESIHVRIALQACAFAGLGWMQEESSLVQHATGLYAQALEATNNALQDPVDVQSDKILACCRLLSLFELFSRIPASSGTGQSQRSDWRSHVEGTCRIVQLRGRERHTSGHGVHLYDGVRMTAIIHALATRRPNSFTTLDWDMPRLTLRDELFDLAATIPELLQQLDLISANFSREGEPDREDQRLQQSQELVGQCLIICNALRGWEMKALDLCRDKQTAVRKEPNDMDTTTSSLFDVCTSYGDGFFFICTQYWAICTTLYSSICLFYVQIPSKVDHSSMDIQIPQLPDWIDPEPHANNIAHTTAHYFRPRAGLWSAQSAVFPVGTALSFFARTSRRDSEQFKMMTDAFTTYKAGAVLREFLQNVLRE